MATGIYYPNSIAFQGIISEPDSTNSCGPYGNTMNDRYEHGSSVMGFNMSLANGYHGLSRTTSAGHYFPSSHSGCNSAGYSMGDWIVWDECVGSETYRASIDSQAFVEWDSSSQLWHIVFGSRPNITNFFYGQISGAMNGFGGPAFGPDANSITVTVTNTNLTATPSTSNDQYGYGGTATIEFVNYNQAAYADGQPNVSPYREASKRNEISLQLKPAFIAAGGVVPLRAQFTPGYRRVSLAPRALNLINPLYAGQRPPARVYVNGRMNVIPGRTRAVGRSLPPYTYPTNYVTAGGPPPAFPVATPTFTPITPTNGQITTINPTNPGGTTIGSLGPTPLVVSPPGSTATAGACNISQPYGALTSISVLNPGIGYTQAPTVTLSGGGGAGATATATIGSSGEVTAINITSGGAGYTSCPTVTLSSPGSTATAGTCTIVGGVLTNIPVSNGGSGYTQAPTVTLTGGCGTCSNPARATATINSAGVVTSINVTQGGSGYTSCPTVTLSASKQTATVITTTSGGNPIGVSVTNPGNGYTATPSIIGTPCTYVCGVGAYGFMMSCWDENLARGLAPNSIMNGVWKKCRKQSSYNHWNGHSYVGIPLGGYVTYDCCGAIPPTALPPVLPPQVQNPQQPTLPRNPITVDPWWCATVEVNNQWEPFPPTLNMPPGADPTEIRGGACNYHKRHGKRNFMHNPHGIAPFQDRERRFELRGMGDGGTHELYGAIRIHRGISFPFSRHQLFFTTFKYRSIDGIRATANAEAASAASTRVYKDMGSHNGAAWEVASFEECFDGALESELKGFLQAFGVIHGDIDTSIYSFIRMVGMVTYQGNMLDSNGKQYCLVYCNKSVPSTVTPIISLAGGYIVLTSSDDIEAKYITMRRIKYAGQ
jgi:hypothetical protein